MLTQRTSTWLRYLVDIILVAFVCALAGIFMRILLTSRNFMAEHYVRNLQVVYVPSPLSFILGCAALGVLIRLIYILREVSHERKGGSGTSDTPPLDEFQDALENRNTTREEH